MLDERAVNHVLTVEDISGKDLNDLVGEEIIRPDAYEDAESSPDEIGGSSTENLVDDSEDMEDSSETASTSDSQRLGEEQRHRRRRAREHRRRTSLLKRKYEKSHGSSQRIQKARPSVRHATAHAGSWQSTSLLQSSASAQLPSDLRGPETSGVGGDEDDIDTEQLPVDDPMDLD